MIPQNELRIGNFVFDDENAECKISCLFSDKKIKYEGYEMDDFQVEYENNESIYLSSVINPIPLTEEWLVKFGFKEQIGWYKFIGGEWVNSIEVSHNDLNKWYCYYRNFNKGTADDFVLLRNDLKYVHQLQNVYFALSSIELSL